MNLVVARTPRGVKVVRRHLDGASVALLLLGLTAFAFIVWLVAAHDQSLLMLVPPTTTIVLAVRHLRTQTAREYLLPDENVKAPSQ